MNRSEINNESSLGGKRLILLVCSSGGHLAQLYMLKPWWKKDARIWVTFNTTDALDRLAEEKVIPAHFPTTRNIFNFITNFLLAVNLFREYKPYLVLSTGAGVAFPFFLVARAFRIPTVYIEVIDRIDSPSLTGRLCYPIATKFLLQWQSQKRFYRKGIVIGPLH